MTQAARRARLAYVALAVGTIGIGLWVHRGTALGPTARDVLGDALWASMIAWWIGALVPRTRLPVRSIVAFGICAIVEFSQLIHTTSLDAIRATTLGQLVLGSGFDPRDLAAYAMGVAVVAGLEHLARQRTRSRAL